MSFFYQAWDAIKCHKVHELVDKHKLQKRFEHVIGLPLQPEGHGEELQTLEAVAHVRRGGLEWELGLKDKTALILKKKDSALPGCVCPECQVHPTFPRPGPSKKLCFLLFGYPHE